MTAERDRAPIDQQWVQHYVDQLLRAADLLKTGPMKDACLRRVEAVMDLLEAWQKRNWEREP